MVNEIILNQQIAIIKKMSEIAKRKPCKTFKGSLTRAFIMIGLARELQDLQIRKKGIPVPTFAKGGIIHN